jgi:hypothetical protein
MPVLRPSASDYTSFVKSGSILRANGKVVKTTVTNVNVSIAAIVATASIVAATSAPRTAILVAPRITSRGPHKGD